MRKLIQIALLAIAAPGCAAYDPSLPPQAFTCGDVDPKCPDGYSCQDDGGGKMVCVTGGDRVDSGGAFTCADQAAFEPNDAPAMAYMTNVGTTQMITFGPISICPETDKDHFKVVTPATANIEVVTSWESGTPVASSILGMAGNMIATGSSSGASSLRACAASQPAGTYFAVAQSSDGTRNNYTMSIKLVPGC
ncbi:MAG: hypothetical protein WKG01_30430 [Kofleriaceae bacterium]